MANGEDDVENDEDIQRAIQMSLSLAQTPQEDLPRVDRSAAQDSDMIHELTEPSARALLHTVVGNLVDNPRETKYRRVKDAAVHKRCTEAAYEQAAVVLRSLGFVVLDEGESPCWWFPQEPEGDKLNRLAKARQQLAIQRDTNWSGDASASSVPNVPLPRLQVPLTELARPATVQVESPVGTLHILAYPDVFVQLVPPSEFQAWASSGSGRLRGRPTGLRADQRALLSICNCCEGLTVTAHWIDWSGSERTAPNLTSWPNRCEMVQTYVLHNFALRLYPQQQVVLCGIRITERPHHTGGHVVVFVTRAAGGDALDLPGFAHKCKRIMEDARADPREPPEAASHQGRAPAPPPPSQSRGKFWGS
eukprot:TRINITY_DN22547_c0_g3_i1.p1 TRINITY_DN22547_c0_g3~~TRINITY_DN22547_c0_g3_i1.p1  ORF type:complete len:363 (+),score=44.24 TRINITY_DN22547_c0_g3_i1:54-1142(+)